MNGGASPEVIVAIQAEIGDLKAKLADAQASIQKSTAQMAQTVETNNPFKKLHEAMRAGGVAIGIHTVTNALSGMANALNEINQGASPFEAFLYNAPLGLGAMARAASDFSIAALGLQSFFAKENPIWGISASGQQFDVASRRRQEDLKRRLKMEDPTTSPYDKAQLQLEQDLDESYRSYQDSIKALDAEVSKKLSEMKKPAYSESDLKVSAYARKEMKDYEDAVHAIRAQEQKRVEQLEKERDLRDEIAKQRAANKTDEIDEARARKDRNDKLRDLQSELQDAQSQLDAVRSNKGTDTVSSAIGAFTFAQRSTGDKADAMLKLQEQIRKILVEIKDIQKQNSQGPN